MKRLLCILDSLNVGGAETFLMKVLRCLSPEDYQFDFIVSKAGGAYSQEVLDRGGKIYTVPPRRKNMFVALRNIRAIVKKNEYQYVLRLGDSPIIGVDLFAAKLGGANRLAFRSCNALTGLSLKARVINAVMRPMLNQISDIKLAPSMLAAEFTFGKRIAQSDVYILHNGVDLSVFRYDSRGREAIRNEFGLKDKLVVGHIGRFHEQKNHRYLLEVFRSIREQRSDAILLLVGTGERKECILQWIHDMELEGKVILAGQRFDIPQLLSAMDVFVFPSLHEGMPNTVIEAQATGLPCVIADTITPEADITGLVQYLSLSLSASEWAEAALEAARQERKDTFADFLRHGYDIESVSKEFISLLRMNGVESV